MITETRMIGFSPEALTAAIRLFGEGAPQRLPAGQIRRVWARTGTPFALSCLVDAGDEPDVLTLELSPAEVAAILIHYCRQEGIPLPRHSDKHLKIDGDDLCLILTKKFALNGAAREQARA